MTTDQTPAYSKEFVDSLLKACVDYRSQVDQLERENAALRAALDAQMKYQRDLRADRDRLDWLETLDCDSHWWVHITDSTNLRDAIDAAQKEAQP